MKKIIVTFSFIFIFSFTFTAFAQTKNFIDQPYIEVTGNADTLITPNEIFIKIVISERDNKNKVSVEESESKMIEAFKSLGINTEKDLVTSDMLSNYKFYFLKQKDILKSKEYILKVTDAATASRVFIQLEDLGISNASIDRVDHTKLETIRNICRAKAVENAKAKAIALTKPIGQSIGNAIFISDNEMVYNNAFQGRVAGVVVTGYGAMDKQTYEPPKIEFEKIKVTSSVRVTFSLK